MTEIKAAEITRRVAKMCVSANIHLPKPLETAIETASKAETDPLCKDVLHDLLENLAVAREKEIPICQDTGMAIVFVTLGQEVHITGGSLTEAINAGVQSGYIEGRLRLSIVRDPLERINTGTNTPAIIYTEIVPGDVFKIKIAPKGFGSENMSRLRMFNPSATIADIKAFVLETVTIADGNPCPPITVGIGIGGDFEYSAYLAKLALCRGAGTHNELPFYATLESQLLEEINSLHIGAQGFGGDITALFVNIEQYATHIAGLPVAVNIGCHVTREKEEDFINN